MIFFSHRPQYKGYLPTLNTRTLPAQYLF